MALRVRTTLVAACLLVLACALPSAALAERAARGTGGVSMSDPRFAPAKKAKIVNGVAIAPRSAPPQVKGVIAAANRIVRKPYHYGGGHQKFEDTGYDCSGSVSYALHGGGLLTAPLDSSSFVKWGLPGAGKWITVYTNPGHAFMMVAGLRFDTGFPNGQPQGTYPGSGPRWRRPRSANGFAARHPNGL